jgi:osmoprotectant transport system ATP-binding protein
MIALEQVARSFGGKVALEPTSLSLARGERLALVGPSGCGKSTLLRLIVGLVAPGSGRVLVEGTEVGPRTARALRQRMGYVIQDGGLFPHLSAHDNVALLASELGWPTTKTARRVAELGELVSLPEQALRRFPSQLSGGQKQRVALMRALMLEPPILLLDEPFGALDPVVRSRLQGDVLAICERLGTTVVLVTHDLAEAAFMAPRLAVLDRGSLVQLGTLDDLARRPADERVSALLLAQRVLSLPRPEAEAEASP